MNYTLIVLLIYAATMFVATVLMTKKEGSVEGFCVGNRDIGWGGSCHDQCHGGKRDSGEHT